MLIPLSVNAQKAGSCYTATALIKTMYRVHVSPPALGAEQEMATISRALNQLDESRFIFLESDVEDLKNYAKGVLDTNENTACAFVDKASEYYLDRWLATDSMMRQLLTEPLTIDPAAEVQLEYSELEGFASSRTEKLQHLKHFTSLALIGEYCELYAEYDSASGTETTAFRDFEKELSQRYLDRLNCDEGEPYTEAEVKHKVTEALLSAIALEFDPHSEYFSPVEKERYQGSLSSETASFGILFGEDDNERINVLDIAPGGPAWKSGSIYEGDLLERITDEAGEEYDLACVDAEDLNAQLDVGEASVLVFHVRHSDGTRASIKLRKGDVDVSNNVIRGMVLSGERKIGYVALPSFYTNWDGFGGLGCANDLAREILNLKNEGIEGLILDLRYNGGGSMGEALQLAGIFINQGTLLIRTTKEGKPRLEKDPNRGTAYDAPLIVMVNGFSASASEIVAAVLQDYNRALIVGSRTYGKSTSQQFFPLLASNGKRFTDGSSGYVKVTQGTMHRITGVSHQGTGIEPDIALPAAYKGLFDREEDLYRALKVEPVNRKTYAYPLPPLPVAELSEKSNARTSSNAAFNDLTQLNKKLLKINDRETLPLNTDVVGSYYRDWSSVFEEISENLSQSESLYKVEQHANSEQLSQLDEFERETVVELKEETASDIYIQEAFNIMLDWIKFVKDQE